MILSKQFVTLVKGELNPFSFFSVLQVQVAGLTSTVVGLAIELKPRRRNKRSILYDLTPEFSKETGQAVGSWSRLEARHIHMLLQNELFINVATIHNPEGELRGQIKALPYSGLDLPRHGMDPCVVTWGYTLNNLKRYCMHAPSFI